MYQVLARRWRPQRFEDVVGQEHVTTTLRNAIAQGRVAHAFLFSGPRGVGKTTVARLLAKALICAKGPTPEPCGTCSSCTEVVAGSALDVVEIDGASNTGVEHIRDLNENVRYRPAAARFKVYIIDEVHMLSTAAFNALLKTLEEPPDHVKFVFATTEVHKLPQTVLSRCQRYEFKRIAMAELVERLRRITADEGIEASDAALFSVAREADGSMRDAQSFLDQVIVFAGKTIEEADVRAALGVADRTILYQVSEAILRRDPAPCLGAVEDLYRYGYEVPRFCRDLVQQLRNLTVAALFRDPALLIDLPDVEVQETMRQAALRPSDDLQRLFRIAQNGAEEVRKSLLPKLVLEMTLVKMATAPDAAPLEELITRLEEMERRLATGAAGGPPAGRPPTEPSRAPSAAPASGRAGTSRRGDAAAGGPAALAATSDAAPVSAGGGTGSRFDAVLVAAQAKAGLRMALVGCRLLDDGAETLHLGVESEFQQRALSEPEQLASLQEIVLRCYGAARRIVVSVVKASGEDAAALKAAAAARARELSDRARANPAVRSALEILGGEIADVRPRSRGREQP